MGIREVQKEMNQRINKGQELQNFINNPDTKEHTELIEKYNTKKGVEKNARILRLFVVDALQNYFRENHFVPHFLPTFLYKGLKGTQLLHFSIIGFKEKPKAGRISWMQGIGEVCNEKLIKTKEGIFKLISDDTLDETDVNSLDSVDLFSNSKTFNKVWQN